MTTVPRDIRIVYVIDKLTLHGTQKMLVLLAQHLAQRHYQQRVYCLKNAIHPAHEAALRQAGIEVRVFGQAQLLMGIGVGRMIAEWRRWQPDIVYTLLFYGNLVGRFAARLAGVPGIVSSIRAKNVYKRSLHFWLDRLTIAWADVVISNSRSAIPFAIEHEGVRPEQVVYIPNAVAPSPIRHEREQFRRTIEIAPDTCVIGSIGRLVPQKGYRCLLQAFHQFHRQMPNSVLIIIGQGPLSAELRAEAENLGIDASVRLLGERVDIPELLSCLDIYVQASLFEGMPNALMEAMSAGKPVIATAVDGNRELIDHGRTGWLVEPENPEMLARALLYAVRHPEEAQRLGQAAGRTLTTEFSVAKMVDAYDRLFQRACQAGHAGITERTGDC